MKSWTDLPAEMQEMVVQRATENTRNALRACSRSSKQLVEGARTTVVEVFNFTDFEPKLEWWNAYGMYSDHSSSLYFFYPNDDEKIRVVLAQIFKPNYAFKKLVICTVPPRFSLKLRNGEKEQLTLLVESVWLYGMKSNVFMKNTLSQMEPGYLRRICINYGQFDSDIMDMAQIVCAEYLEIWGVSNIREEQLLKLEARELTLKNINCSVLEYIQKCVRKAGTKMPKFSFTGSSFAVMGLDEMVNQTQNSRLLLDTPHPGLKFELEFGKISVKGRVIYESESCSTEFWRLGGYLSVVIEHLEIISDEAENRQIKLRRRFYPDICYDFKTAEELQQKLDVILENADLVKEFYIKFVGSQDNLHWKPRENKLMVKKLDVVGNNSNTSIRDLLEQIDPAFPMEVKITKNTELESCIAIFDMPVIHNASSVTIENPYLTDEQMMKINANSWRCDSRHDRREVEEEEEDSSPNPNPGIFRRFVNFISCVFNGKKKRIPGESITAEAVNQYIKKRISLAVQMESVFAVGVVSKSFNLAAMVEGLEIIEMFKGQKSKVWIVKTSDSKYIISVGINPAGVVGGNVVKRDWYEPRRKMFAASIR